ncbi:unnamed protein product, partial [Hapterophycus canaliculatus]
LLHAFYKWSCREFGEPVKPPPARVVPDIVRLTALEKKLQQQRKLQFEQDMLDFFPGPMAVGVRFVGRLGMLGGDDPLISFEECEQIALEEKLLRQQQQQEQERRKRQEMLLQQQHQHDPVDSLSHDGSMHLYFRQRNIFTHNDANNPSYSKLTSVSWINETSKSLLLTGAGDGVARVWGGVIEAGLGETEGGRMRVPELVTSFHALSPSVSWMRGGDLDKAGLVTHWQQRRGLLSAAGACRQLNVWDLASEQLWTEWEVPEGSAVSALRAPTDNSPGPLGGWVMAAGMTDGEVMLYDAREKGQSTVSKLLKLHSWVLDLYFTDGGGGHEILTGCSDGHVTIQDIRKASDDNYEPFTAKVQRTMMTAFTMHPRVPVLATGSYKQFINIITPRGGLLSRIKGHTGLFDQRLGCVTSLAFHPNQLMLAAGTTDQVLSIFAHDGTT